MRSKLIETNFDLSADPFYDGQVQLYGPCTDLLKLVPEHIRNDPSTDPDSIEECIKEMIGYDLNYVIQSDGKNVRFLENI